MSEYEPSLGPPKEGQVAGKLDDESILEDARPLCLNCLKPCDRLQSCCENYDSNEVVNPLVSYMAFVHLCFTCGFFGKMRRELWYNKKVRSHLSYFAVLNYYFCPHADNHGLAVVLSRKDSRSGAAEDSGVAFHITAVVLPMIFVYLGLSRGSVSPPDTRS